MAGRKRGFRPRRQKNSVPLPTELATREDLCWLAGFYEGEGSCRGYRGSLELHLAQKDPECLLKAQRLFGGSVLGPYKSVTQSGKATFVHLWRLGGEAGRNLAVRLLPLLSKRRRAQLLSALPDDWLRDVILQAWED